MPTAPPHTGDPHADDSRTGDVREAYDRRASEYAEAFADTEMADPDDRRAIRAWAAACTGEIVDAGCGPGHWTNDLRARGARIIGMDQSREFIAIARQRFPRTEYREATLQHTGAATATLGGVLSWFSLIHTPPTELGAIVAEFHRILAPGGSLLIGGFAWPTLEQFDHAVITAYRWPPELLAQRLEQAQFCVVDIVDRAPSGERPVFRITAVAERTSVTHPLVERPDRAHTGSSPHPAAAKRRFA